MFRAENEASKLALEQPKHMFRVEELQEKQRRYSFSKEQDKLAENMRLLVGSGLISRLRENVERITSRRTSV